MKGQISRRGDARAEYRAALAEKDSVPRSARHMFHRALVDMDMVRTTLSGLCVPITGREGLFSFDCLVSGMAERSARPWAAMMWKDGELLLLHVVPEFTGGRAERAAAESEAIARFDLE
jgi:hypothetical protein